MMKSFSTGEFNHNPGRATRAADDGPAIITERGVPRYVLLRHDEYQRLFRGSRSMRDMLDHPASADIAFDPRPVGLPQTRPVDLE